MMSGHSILVPYIWCICVDIELYASDVFFNLRVVWGVFFLTRHNNIDANAKVTSIVLKR
jgi:hypothetical protein